MLHKGGDMKNIALLILSISAMNLASFAEDESIFDQMSDVILIKDSVMVKSKCPPTTSGCLTLVDRGWASLARPRPSQLAG